MYYKRFFLLFAMILAFLLGMINVGAEEIESAPEEYDAFLDSLPQNVIDDLPENAFSGDVNDISEAARLVSSPTYLLKIVLDAFGSNVSSLAPTLALLCGIIMMAAVARSLSSSFGGGVGNVAEACIRLCTFCAICSLSVSSLGRLEEYFNSLFESVAAFLPLSAVLYAMGGNLTGAASASASLNTTLAICQFFCAKTAIPVFCLCLSFSLLSAFEGIGANVGVRASASIKKWYVTFLSLIMMILTITLASQNLLSAKADGVAMRGAKFAVSSFVPLSGGTLSGTLGTLASSIELMRGAVGVIGVAVILLLLIPVVIELALLKGILSIAAFASGMVGCSGEEKLINEVGSLYGYLEGAAALCSAVFIIAFAIFASTATPFS